MRLRGIFPRRRFLFAQLWDKLSQGAGRLSRHKAQYSLDCEDGIEYSACLHEPTPDEVLERKERFCRLWNALNSLPPAQGRRVDACVILGKSFSEVALAEGVDESAVRRAVERGLENMKKFLKNSR